MNPQTLLLIVSALLIVFAFGLRARLHDATYLFRRPGELVRAILAMYVLMPAFAVGAVLLYDFHPAVKIALVTLAVSPMAPILPAKLMKAGATESYAIGLLVSAGMLAVVMVPVAMEILGRVFNMPLQMSAVSVASLVFMSVLLPLGLGLAVHSIKSVPSERLAKIITIISGITLLAFFFVVLIGAAPAIWMLIGNGTLLALIAFVLIGTAIGHFLGGPNPENRTGLAISTASRHPGIALAIAQANFPDQKLAPAAMLLYIFVNAIISLPYFFWTRRRASSVAEIQAKP